MKYLIAILATIAIVGLFFRQTESTNVDAEFTNFVAEYRKSYFSSEEYNFRKGVFAQNLKEIAELNSNSNKATFGINHFADWTQEEKAKLLGAVAPMDNKEIPIHKAVTHQDKKDWREQIPFHVKDQQSCGSCWAFASVEALEETYEEVNGAEWVNLSEQELVDCSGWTGNMGCNGGWMYWAYDYVLKAGGLASESDYPYHAVDQSCQAEGLKHYNPITGYKQVEMGNQDALMNAIDTQSVTVAVDASYFFSYTGGVFDNCGENINHAVVAIGYTDEYWIIQNSWGARWGEAGYIRLAMGNTCAILDYAYFPTI